MENHGESKKWLVFFSQVLGLFFETLSPPWFKI